MHPPISYYLAQARTADLRHQAQRDALARAARRAGPGAGGQALAGYPPLHRRVRRKPSSRTVLDAAREAGRAAAREALERASASPVA